MPEKQVKELNVQAEEVNVFSHADMEAALQKYVKTTRLAFVLVIINMGLIVSFWINTQQVRVISCKERNDIRKEVQLPITDTCARFPFK